MRIMLLVGIAWMIQAMAASATMVFGYDAGTGATVPSPEQQNWMPSPQTYPDVVDDVVNDLGLGVNAWKIGDVEIPSTANYFRAVPDLQANAAQTNGWRLKANMRLVDAVSVSGSGLAMFWNGRGYHLMLHLNSNNALVASYSGSINTTPLTPPQVGDDAYHDVELRWTPGSTNVEFWFDGVLKHQWAGLVMPHDNVVRFGQVMAGGRSEANFRKVTFEVGPYLTLPNLAGDYNLDGLVDLRDFTVWRNNLGRAVAPYAGADGDGNGFINREDYLVWKRNFDGSLPSALEISAQPIPEPPLALAAMLSGLTGTRLVRRRRKLGPSA
jgi:hypothetical protein